MKGQSQNYEELWQNPDNWRLYILYIGREDPRIIVPKRFRVTGWTLNFAHVEAYLLLAGLFAVVIVPITIVEVTGLGSIHWMRPTAVVISILAILVLTWWAGRQRIE
jgi:hypothetical protein